VENKNLIYLTLISLTACSSVPVKKTQTTTPEIKVTTFTQAIEKLGLMYEIYAKPELRIMPTQILDKTGTSAPSKGEIPYDVTDMMKTSLNNIGGGILFVPYNPVYMQQLAITGYTEWGEKLIPGVVIDGGITEFDRSLSTIGDGIEGGVASSLGSSPFGLDFGNDNKSSVSRATVDFNLIDFKRNVGIPHKSATNSIELYKSVGEKSIGATIYGVTLGSNSTVKHIQARHEAIRLLIQLSVIQIVGKYKQLPYWRLLPSIVQNERVYDEIEEKFEALTPEKQALKINEYLYMNGFNVEVTEEFDEKSQQALNKFQQQHSLSKLLSTTDPKTFFALYNNVPITKASKKRRKQLNRTFNPATAYITLASNSIDMGGNGSRGIDLTRSIDVTSGSSSSEIKTEEPKEQLLPLGKIELSTDKTQYKQGDKMTVSFKVDQPMFVSIVSINAEGKMARLFPNAYQPDGFVKPHSNYSIPPNNTNASITVKQSSGVDKIYAFASHQQISPSQLKVKNGKIDEDYLKSLLKPNQANGKHYVKSVVAINVVK